MAKNQDVFFTKTPKIGVASIVGSNTTIYTAGADGGKLLGLQVVSISSGTPSLKISVNDGGGDVVMSIEKVVIEGENLMDLIISALDKNGNKYLNLDNGWIVKATQTGGTNVNVAFYAEDY